MIPQDPTQRHEADMDGSNDLQDVESNDTDTDRQGRAERERSDSLIDAALSNERAVKAICDAIREHSVLQLAQKYNSSQPTSFTGEVGIEWAMGLPGWGKSKTHGYSAFAFSLTSDTPGTVPSGLSGQIIASTEQPIKVWGAEFSIGNAFALGNAKVSTDFSGITHNRSLTVGGIQVTLGKTDSGKSFYGIGMGAGIGYSEYDTQAVSRSILGY